MSKPYIDIKDTIGKAFYNVHIDIKNERHTHYWLKGGRGSCKSSFISVEIPTGIMRDSQANAVIFRKYGISLEKSVYNQILWAINILGVNLYWKAYKSPLRLEYLPTGQEIIFMGMDDPQKIKSLKPRKGYFKYIWFEEVNEADGMDEIRNILQSTMRGGEKFCCFYSFNPPANVANWVNIEVNEPRQDKLVHHSTYLDVPQAWLGKQFFIEAEFLKKHKEISYRHEYLGEATGTGLNVFDNLIIREITDDELKQFSNLREGIDWGYAADPFAYVKLHYSPDYRRIYIFDEIYEYGLLNTRAIDLVKQKHESSEIIADSEDPKSVGDFWDAGFYCVGAKKGPGSRGYSYKFLQDLIEIVIDPIRCPHAAKEFQMAEFEKMKDGTIRNEYPDKNDHLIDATRYALNRDMPLVTKC